MQSSAIYLSVQNRVFFVILLCLRWWQQKGDEWHYPAGDSAGGITMEQELA